MHGFQFEHDKHSPDAGGCWDGVSVPEWQVRRRWSGCRAVGFPGKSTISSRAGHGCGGKSILISFSATAMWESQKKDFPTNHAPGGVHGDLHFAYVTLVVHKRVKA